MEVVDVVLLDDLLVVIGGLAVVIDADVVVVGFALAVVDVVVISFVLLLVVVVFTLAVDVVIGLVELEDEDEVKGLVVVLVVVGFVDAGTGIFTGLLAVVLDDEPKSRIDGKNCRFTLLAGKAGCDIIGATFVHKISSPRRLL